MIREPKVGDLWIRGSDHMRVVAIHTNDDATMGASVWYCDDRDGVASDVPWPDGFEDWTLAVRGAVPLDERPPVPERDERSEVDRLRAELLASESAADREIERLRAENAALNREMVRIAHGAEIEGDGLCPHELAVQRAIPRADVVRALRYAERIRGDTLHAVCSIAEDLGIAREELEVDS